MTSVLFASGAGNTSDSLSSPWLDYNSSTVYVGANNGLLYQITNALSSPTLSGGSWPITVSSGYSLTSPVLDTGLGLLMVGSANGSVYQIDTTLGATVGTLAVGVGTGSGFWDPPIVDVTEGTTFVVNANTGGPSALRFLCRPTPPPLWLYWQQPKSAKAPITAAASTQSSTSPLSATVITIVLRRFNHCLRNRPRRHYALSI